MAMGTPVIACAGGLRIRGRWLQRPWSPQAMLCRWQSAPDLLDCELPGADEGGARIRALCLPKIVHRI
jgi:hypothetical protein